jgi:hypothetical protein
MPNRSHSGIKGDPWHYCDVCGFLYRCSELRWQFGALKCHRCIDSLRPYIRELLIQENISNGADEEMRPAEVLTEPSDDSSSLQDE